MEKMTVGPAPPQVHQVTLPDAISNIRWTIVVRPGVAPLPGQAASGWLCGALDHVGARQLALSASKDISLLKEEPSSSR